MIFPRVPKTRLMTTISNHIDNLITLLRIPSISTQEKHMPDIMEAVAFLESLLKEAGFTTIARKYAQGCEDMPPVICAERIDNPENPTILVYNHYDVQPADPLDEWKKPPFEPIIENGNIYGRGTTDDKGQLITHLAALSELSKEWGETWPINIKIIYEGQEESGGENLHLWLQEKETQELLKADIAVISDTGFRNETTPAIIYGLRGIVYFQIDVTLAEHDLHSGVFGGSVLNPINALAHMISNIYDATTGLITIPGFYDDVVVLDEEEKELLAKVPFDEKQHLIDAGKAHALHGETGYTHKERLCARPTLDINGIWGGFMDEGAKTIIPKSAHAKFSCRLVPNQTPDKIVKIIQTYVESIAPKQVKVTITHIHSGHGVLVDRKSSWMKAAVSALKETFGNEPVFDREGGSIPAVADFKTYLGIDTLLFGYSLPDDNLHAPNEKFSLKQFELGIECNKRFYKNCVHINRPGEKA